MFLFTQFQQAEETIIDFNKLTPQEKIQFVKAEEQKNTDQINYDRAIVLKNGIYCDSIIDADLREQCKLEVPESVQIEKDERSEIEITDETNYNRAKILKDKTYCEYISNEDLKQKCLTELPE